MKPTLKVIVTGPVAADGTRFVTTLSDLEVTLHERKVTNPLSATREEAVLHVEVGRAEWEDLAVQVLALPVQKRLDFIWATLLREVHGVVVLVDSGDPETMDEVRRVLKLFGRLQLVACLVGLTGAADSDAQTVAEAQKSLGTTYPIVPCALTDRASVERAIRALVALVPAPEAQARKE